MCRKGGAHAGRAERMLEGRSACAVGRSPLGSHHGTAAKLAGDAVREAGVAGGAVALELHVAVVVLHDIIDLRAVRSDEEQEGEARGTTREQHLGSANGAAAQAFCSRGQGAGRGGAGSLGVAEGGAKRRVEE